MTAPTPTVEAESREAWVLVPREPTDAMNEAAKPYRKAVGSTAQLIYRAMIAAAPSPATGTVSKDEIVSILKASLSNHDMAAQCILNLIALASPVPIAGPTKEEVVAAFAALERAPLSQNPKLWGYAVAHCRAAVLALFNGAGR